MRRVLLLLVVACCGCATVGTTKAPIIEPEGRFAFFSGAYSDEQDDMMSQLRFEYFDVFIMRSLSTLARRNTGDRFVGNAEVMRRYGKNYLPIVPPRVRDSNFRYKQVTQGPSCDPRTAALIRDRLGIDVFGVIWTLSAPPMEKYGLRKGEGGVEFLKPYNFLIQVFSVKDCGSLGHWKLVVVHKGLLAPGGLDASEGQEFAGQVAKKIIEELRLPLRLSK